MKTKYILLLFILSLFSKYSFSQCNVKKLERDDGVTIQYTRPDRIGYCDKFVLGLSMQTNGKDFFVVALCLFETNVEKLKGDLVLFFNNEKSSRLQFYGSELTTVKGTPATMNTFIANDNDLKNIANSNIKMGMAQLSDGVYQTIKIMVNAGKLKTDYACLKSNLIN